MVRFFSKDWIVFIYIIFITVALIADPSRTQQDPEYEESPRSENPAHRKGGGRRRASYSGGSGWLGRTSGARSSYPVGALLPFNHNFNLISLLNVFREFKAKFSDGNDNLIKTEEDDQFTSSNQVASPNLMHTSVDTSASQSLMPDLMSKLGSQRTKKIESNRQMNPTSPVILVPGYGGSRLEVKLDKPKAMHYFCDARTDWIDLWVNVKYFLPYMIDCLIDNLRLEFDYATNTTKNTPGVEIRVKNSTQLASVEYLSNQLPISGFAYFAPVIARLTNTYGYERDLSIQGAPYDFRKAPDELGHYFQQLKLTSEQMFYKNDLKPVTYICHSMGCNNLLYFFHQQTQQWKNKYVKRLISIAAPWGGSLSAMRAAAIGDDLGMPYLFSESKLVRVQRSLPSTIYLFPHSKVFGGVPLIRSNVGLVDHYLSRASNSTFIPNQSSSWRMTDKVYKSDDYKEFFDDTNHPEGYKIWQNTKNLLGNLEAPGVEVWCLVGRGLRTLGRMEYVGEFPSSPGVEFFDDGDGTVNIGSAQYCNAWSKEQKQPVHYKEFNVGHMEILKHDQVIHYIEAILNGEMERKEYSIY